MRGPTLSPWILHYDASSCNGCDIETLACLTPIFDVERLGVVNTGNPKHADIFLVTGAVNEQSKVVIRNLYGQLPEPKVVVAVGACAATGGIFRECYNISGGVDAVVPVDVFVPGCAARPEAIIDGVVKGLAVMEEKRGLLAAARDGLDKVFFARAEKADAAYILGLRKAAGQADAALHGDEAFPVLQQTLEEMEREFDRKIIFKAVVNGKIIGAVGGCRDGETVSVDGPAVHPYFQDTDVAERLIKEIEGALPEAKRFETFVAHKNVRSLQQLAGAGYRNFKTEAFTPKITWIYLRKERL
jgi:ech hydrogenase subunit C